MTYNRDLQEDKQRLFDTSDTVRACVRICAAMLGNTSINRAACLKAAGDPALLATDLADYLVSKGLPFRQAHHAVGALVAAAEELGKPLNQLSLAEFQAVNKRFACDVLNLFDLEGAMARREMPGAPGTGEVRKQVLRWRKLLG
jgi:argininosuccinate lyase